MKKIGLLTRDCAGVNAAIRSVVRSAVCCDIDVAGVLRGYDGLIDGDVIPLDRQSVSGIINRGGTMLKTARSQRFCTEQGQKQAVETIRNNNIDGLIVIGGNGSLTGAHLLATRYGIPVVGIPATIDNDVNGVDLTIGADTAINVALDAVDKIRDTVSSLERIFIVEVMGRSCGYLALQVALAGGCEEVLLPEQGFDVEMMCNEIVAGNTHGKTSWIIIVAEGTAKAQDIAAMITGKTGLETRVAVLGHIQRGGAPSAIDRILAARLGNFAVEVLLDGATDCCVGLKDDRLITIPLEVAIQHKKLEVESFYKLIKILT
ncbi:MAG: ATP-dependent 6-phosphofructokinase [Euryarchaeota archaeon]|nr:ATP-dependent 6-phosphofructokinase [Euryarchaeota archaeon]